MASSATLTHKMSLDGTVLAGAKQHTGTDYAGIYVPVTCLADCSDQEVTVAIDVSHLKALFVWCDGTDMLVETNNAVSGVCDDSFTIYDDIPYTWDSTSNYHTCKLGTDVTKIFLTDQSSAASTFYILAIYDSTP